MPPSSTYSSERRPLPSGPSQNVFNLIHTLHTTITQSIDTALTWDQLNSPPVNYTLVRPIVEQFPSREPVEKAGNGLLAPPSASDGGEQGAIAGRVGKLGGGVSMGGVLYALMANRIQFISLSSGDMSYSPLQTTRAAFCELLAMKILRTFPDPNDEVDLVGQLVKNWCAFDGAPESVWASIGPERSEVEEARGSALELAIVSSSKHFLSLPLMQHLISQIYSGHLIYSPTSSRSLISDSYVSERTKARRRNSNSTTRSPVITPESERIIGLASTPVEDENLAEVYVYNPYEAGWLDHQRLRVPRWRKWLDFLNFAVLLGLFVTTLSYRDLQHFNAIEIVFVVYTLGFTLDEFAASKEHGWTVYAANAWNAFDMAFIFVFLLYFSLRVFALATQSLNTSDLAFDILACGACILFPRLVFFLIKDNTVILALRAMIAQFVGFMGLTIVAFSGICFCLWTLGRGTWTVKQIVWLMLQIWFGSSYLGFSASESFHPVFGPIVLISYAALSNVLLITILISILSNKFAEINANAQEEHLFQRAVSTVEGVKSDALFSYLPPVNIVALIFLLPLSWVCSPRTLHRINVFGIRLTSFPILVAISAYERWCYHQKQRSISLKGSTTDGFMDHFYRPRMLDSFLGGGSEDIITSVFEAGPPAPTSTNSVSDVRGGTATPPKASSIPSLEDHQKAAQTPPPLPSTAARPFDSPLAKLFGKPSAIVPGLARLPPLSSGTHSVDGKVVVGAGEVEKVQEELKVLRESQLRMEEMLSKLLAGTGGK